MAWTVTVRDVKQSNRQWDLSLIFTDGVTTLTKGYVFQALSDEIIRATARREVATFTQAEQSTITLGAGANVDLTPPASPPAPLPDPDLDTFRTRFRQLQQLIRLVEHGIIVRTDSRIVALVDAIKADWQARFLSEI